ncbi:aminodeoxychorismate/anthranilate synthase component II [Thalassoglobus sp. JC818]|uniref:anthranilate synthase component II n=1 Tax=Thalassoglobus sp. JC818 TaxID=3232136 RepID=UPI0034598930
MIFVLDNYDSFTYNLVQRLGEIDSSLDIRVYRNDQISCSEIDALNPSRIIISPGPCTPAEAGLSCEVIRHFAPRVPLLGVCLGHQCISEAFGGEVVRADRLMHGKTSAIHHDQQGIFRGIETPAVLTRYHSLIVPETTLPEELIPCAWTRDEDHPAELMAVRHRDYPVHGVQFHPESFLSDCGTDILRNFLKL